MLYTPHHEHDLYDNQFQLSIFDKKRRIFCFYFRPKTLLKNKQQNNKFRCCCRYIMWRVFFSADSASSRPTTVFLSVVFRL